jgi:hypothetical protein
MNPIAVIVLTLVLLALFIATLIATAQMIKRQKKARRRAFAAAAAEKGWLYEESSVAWANAFGIKPFRKGAGRHARALDVVSGTVYGHRAVGLRYRYTRGTNPDNLSDIYSWYTVCGVELPPDLESVDPERKTFAVDRGNQLVRRVMRKRRVTWCIDGNWLVCWERGENARPEVVFDRLQLLAAIVEGQAGRVAVRSD